MQVSQGWSEFSAWAPVARFSGRAALTIVVDAPLKAIAMVISKPATVRPALAKCWEHCSLLVLAGCEAYQHGTWAALCREVE